MRLIKDRKVWGTILGTLLFLYCILFFTYAYYTWRSDDEQISFEFEDLSTECVLGPDVNVTNIGPVLNVQDGVKVEFSVGNETSSEIEVALNLGIVSIHENLRVESFKYVLVRDVGDGNGYDYNNFILEGNFSSVVDNQTLVLADIDDSTDIPGLSIAANSTYSFLFIVYIDGSVYNDVNMQNNSMVASLEIGNCGTVTLNSISYVRALYNDGSELKSVGVNGDAVSVSLNDNSNIMLDNNGEYRYYGSSPSNYVRFNNELWRIISISNVKSSADDTVGEERIKIIKADSLVDDNGYSQFVFDSSDSSDWSQADLMTLLNNLYYNRQSGDCYGGSDGELIQCNFTNSGLSDEALGMIEPALWYLGNSNQGQYANTAYNRERGSGAATWSGVVGLMYQSDYGYAADLSICTTYIGAYNNCVSNNWLFNKKHEFSIVPLIGYDDRLLTIYSGGSFNITNAYDSLDVRPVVYLKSDVLITGGNGSKDVPYELALG